MKYKFEFRTADGRSCCKADDFESLCATCRAQVTGNASNGPTRSASALRTAAGDVYRNPPNGYALAGSRQRIRALLTDVDLRAALEIALRRSEPPLFMGIRAVENESVVIYDVVDEQGIFHAFSRTFTMDEDGQIVLSVEREEVRAETSYVAARLAAAQKGREEFYSMFTATRLQPPAPRVASGREDVYRNPPDPYQLSLAARRGVR